jgi:hypothetical protein
MLANLSNFEPVACTRLGRAEEASRPAGPRNSRNAPRGTFGVSGGLWTLGVLRRSSGGAPEVLWASSGRALGELRGSSGGALGREREREGRGIFFELSPARVRNFELLSVVCFCVWGLCCCRCCCAPGAVVCLRAELEGGSWGASRGSNKREV